MFNSCSLQVLPHGYIDTLGFYRMGKKDSRVNNMIHLGIEQVLTFPNLFTYYEQDMVKFILLFDHYNNVYQGWYEKW